MFKFTLLENEQIIGTYRQSEAVLFKPVIIIFILIYFPWFFLLKFDVAATYFKYLLVWTVLVFIYGIYEYILWLVNVSVITNRRVVSIHYKSLFKKIVSETPFDHIANIGFKTTGIFSSLFGYGDVEVKILSVHKPLILEKVRQPAAIKDLLWDLKGKTESTAKAQRPLNIIRTV